MQKLNIKIPYLNTFKNNIILIDIIKHKQKHRQIKKTKSLEKT